MLQLHEDAGPPRRAPDYGAALAKASRTGSAGLTGRSEVRAARRGLRAIPEWLEGLQPGAIRLRPANSRYGARLFGWRARIWAICPLGSAAVGAKGQDPPSVTATRGELEAQTAGGLPVL